MALIIARPTDYGISATYWRIAHVSDYFVGRVEVTVLGYADAAACAARRAPLDQIKVWLDGIEPARADLYAALKQAPEFHGAIDA